MHRRTLRTRLLPVAVLLMAALGMWTRTGRAADAKSDWPAYAGDKGSTKYSPLDQINATTVKNLRVAWRQSAMPEELRAAFPGTQGPPNYQHTPLVVDGLM